MTVWIVQQRYSLDIIGVYGTFNAIPSEYTDADLRYLILEWPVTGEFRSV